MKRSPTPILFAVLAAACGDGHAPHKPDAGSTVAVAFSYAPKGCAYAISPPARVALTDLALDDAAAAGSAPIRVRLGLGGGTVHGAPGYADPTTSIAMTWETADKTKAAKVKLGASAGALDDVHAGYAWTTPPPETGFGSNEPETYMHEVHVCGLDPGKTYYYQVGGGTPEVWSATQSFTTVPAAGSGPVTVGILGDSRDKVEVWQLAERRMRDKAVAMQITSGDLVFIGQQQSLYRTWLDAIWHDPSDASRFVTLGDQLMMMVAGNHEGEAANFYAGFAMPGDGDYAESYSSFDAGNTHYVLVDDTPIGAYEGSEHAAVILKWLDADLAKADANRDKVPFILAVNHRGLYTTSLHATDGDVLVTRNYLAPIYSKYHVDVVVNGHDHIYERTKPVLAGADPAGVPQIVGDGQGTVYIVNAGAGADPYAVGTNPNPAQEKSITFGPSTPYSGFYAVVTMDAKKLKIDSYGLTAAGNDPIVDTVELSK